LKPFGAFRFVDATAPALLKGDRTHLFEHQAALFTEPINQRARSDRVNARRRWRAEKLGQPEVGAERIA
jgi:hypothetical protein